jgi:hypothetical protein
MRISNPLLIGIFIILLVALNTYVIPEQRKVQLQLDKKVIWEIPTAVDIILDYTLLGPNSLIQSVSTESHFQLQSFDLKTGKLIQTKVFSEEIGLAHQVECIENALYVVFANSSIYKLDATTLEIRWKTDWKLEVYDWISISIEASKDLILIAAFNPYSNFYTFIEQETGAIYARQKREQEYIVEEPIAAIFEQQGDINWGTYYNFKNNKFIFDTIWKSIHFIEDDYLMDISNPLTLTSFAINSERYIYKKTYERSYVTRPFVERKKALYLKTGLKRAFSKELTNIQTSTQSIVFCFQEKEDQAALYDLHTVNYVFLGKDAPYADLSIQNMAYSPRAYASEDYFVALELSTQAKSHQEILLIDLNDLGIKESFYAPSDQVVLKLFCDQKQVYALVQKPDKKTYWLAVPIHF